MHHQHYQHPIQVTTLIVRIFQILIQEIENDNIWCYWCIFLMINWSWVFPEFIVLVFEECDYIDIVFSYIIMAWACFSISSYLLLLVSIVSVCCFSFLMILCWRETFSLGYIVSLVLIGPLQIIKFDANRTYTDMHTPARFLGSLHRTYTDMHTHARILGSLHISCLSMSLVGSSGILVPSHVTPFEFQVLSLPLGYLASAMSGSPNQHWSSR